MRMNFEFAFHQASGDYVISFCDDDGILPGQFPILRRLLTERRPDAASWSLPAYCWLGTGYWTKVGGIRFSARDCFGKAGRLQAGEARATLQSGQLHDFTRLPRIYHGAMSRDLLQRMKYPAGILFRARSPDIYASFRAVIMDGTSDYYPHPFTINGHSPASTGGSMNAVGDRQQGGAADTRFLAETAIDPVEDIVPVTMSMGLAYLVTAQTAAAVVPRQEFAPDFRTRYRAALRDMRRKQADVAAQIDASLIAHAAQFGSQDGLARARFARGKDWQMLRHRLRNSLAKLRPSQSFRLLFEEDGINTIETAARMCDVVLGREAHATGGTGQGSSSAWKKALARSGCYKRQI